MSVVVSWRTASITQHSVWQCNARAPAVNYTWLAVGKPLNQQDHAKFLQLWYPSCYSDSTIVTLLVPVPSQTMLANLEWTYSARFFLHFWKPIHGCILYFVRFVCTGIQICKSTAFWQTSVSSANELWRLVRQKWQTNAASEYHLLPVKYCCIRWLQTSRAWPHCTERPQHAKRTAWSRTKSWHTRSRIKSFNVKACSGHTPYLYKTTFPGELIVVNWVLLEKMGISPTENYCHFRALLQL